MTIKRQASGWTREIKKAFEDGAQRYCTCTSLPQPYRQLPWEPVILAAESADAGAVRVKHTIQYTVHRTPYTRHSTVGVIC